jgi:hypothetical protein
MVSYSKKKELLYNVLFLVVFVLLFAVAGFRPVGFDRDSENYSRIIESIITTPSYGFVEGPSFYLIVKLSSVLFKDVVRGVFIIYALLGVLLTLYAIRKISTYPILSLIVYVLLYFPLHAMTQFRLSVAAAIFLLSIPDIVNRNWKSYLVKTVFAISFHYIAFIMLFIYFIKSKREGTCFYLFLPLIGFLLAIINAMGFIVRYINLAGFLIFKNHYIEYILNHYLEYVELTKIGAINKSNIFNVYISSLLIIYYFAIVNIKKFTFSADLLMLKIFGWMLFAFYFLSFSQVISGRISEFLGVVLIFFLPDLLCAFSKKREKLVMSFFVILYSVLMAINFIFIHKLFNF